jgi:uncharacterized membrane protein
LIAALIVAALALSDLANSRRPRFSMRNVTLLVAACALLVLCVL